MTTTPLGECPALGGMILTFVVNLGFKDTRASLPATALTAAGLVGGFATARATKNRPLGGAILTAAGAGAFALWKKESGLPAAIGLTALYLGSFGGSHPLAKKIGAWPAVWTVTGVTAAASLLTPKKKD